MTSLPDGAEALTEDSCWNQLRRTSVGRIAIDVDGHPDIFPINYVVDGTSIVFRTRPGTKLAGCVNLQRVAFEIDGFEQRRGAAWSVVVKGHARSVDGRAEASEVADLPLYPWVTFDKPVVVRIVPLVVTGRRYALDDEVITDSSIG